MEKDQLTFNDLPTVVGELCNRIASMENLLTEKLSRQNEVKENTHVPMTVQEACAYLKMPLSTFYYKVKKDDIPVIKQDKHLYIYRDELDKWLESSRKTPAPQSFEDENNTLLKADPEDVIVHYIDYIKPWHIYCLDSDEKKLYWRYVQKSLWDDLQPLDGHTVDTTVMTARVLYKEGSYEKAVSYYEALLKYFLKDKYT